MPFSLLIKHSQLKMFGHEGNENMLVPFGPYFAFHCSFLLSVLHSFYPQLYTCLSWGLGPVCRVTFHWCKQQERDAYLDHRIALGTHGSWKQMSLIFFFIFIFPSLFNIFSMCCVGQCKLQIGGVQERRRLLLPWDIYPRKIFSWDIVWALLNSDREKERMLREKIEIVITVCLREMHAVQEKKRTITSRDFSLWKTEKKLGLHFK